MSINLKDFDNLESQIAAAKKLLGDLPPTDRAKVALAMELAIKTHAGQERMNGGSFVIHPIRCARMLLEEIKITDSELLSAALLHDTVEDTKLTLPDVTNQFGERVSTLVYNLTRERELNETREEGAKNRIRKLLKYRDADQDTRLLKCVDMVDNLRSWCRVTMEYPDWQIIRKNFVMEGKEYGLPLATMTNPIVTQAMAETITQLKLIGA